MLPRGGTSKHQHFLASLAFCSARGATKPKRRPTRNNTYVHQLGVNRRKREIDPLDSKIVLTRRCNGQNGNFSLLIPVCISTSSENPVNDGPQRRNPEFCFLSASVSVCQRLSASVSNCQPLSATVSVCQQLSAKLHRCGIFMLIFSHLFGTYLPMFHLFGTYLVPYLSSSQLATYLVYVRYDTIRYRTIP